MHEKIPEVHGDWRHWVLIVAFGSCIVAPLAGHVLGMAGAETIWLIEQRQPSPRPGRPRNTDQIKQLPNQLDAYFDDHFGFRSRLLRLNSFLLFSVGVSGSDRVMIGKDNWLFLRNRHRVVEEYRGLIDPGEREIDSWIQQMKQRQDWLGQRGVHSLVVIPPNKHSVYSEFLPPWVTRVAANRFDRISRKAGAAGLNFLDLRPTLIGGKETSGELLYSRGGTHWNARGAYLSYRSIMAELTRHSPELETVEEGDVEFFENGHRNHDLARMLNVGSRLQEPFVDFRLLRPSRVTRVQETRELRNARIVYSELAEGRSVLMIADSFVEALRPFIQESFSRSVFIHHRHNVFEASDVDRFRPDVVITMILERYLYCPAVNNLGEDS